MKKCRRLTSVFFVTVMLFGASIVFAQQNTNKNVSGEAQKQTQDLKMEYYSIIRNNQDTKQVDYTDYEKALKDLFLMKDEKNALLDWESIGPTNIAGRVRGLIFDKNNPNVLYAGGVSGGIWKTTNNGQSWFMVNPGQESLIVSCMTQASDGTIYFGTGEGFAPTLASNNGGSGFVGKGLFKSTDATGTAFVQIASTNPSSDNSWEYIYKVAIHPNGDIYCATQKGIKKSTNGGSTWANPLPGSASTTQPAFDVDISADGSVVIVVVLNKVYISTDSGSSFTNISTGGNMLPSTGLSRIELDISPSDNNYIYACAAKQATSAQNPVLHNIYRSTDKGQTWTIIGPGGSTNFNPLGNLGNYANVIKVHPTNKNKIYCGGEDMWVWEEGGNWEPRSSGGLSPYSNFYLHSQHHAYVFNPTNPDIMFIATDGGISKSTDGGNSFEVTNRNLVTSQFFSFCYGLTGELLAGTSGNGTLYIPRNGFEPGKATQIIEDGDGGMCAISQLNPSLLFLSAAYGNVYRTPNKNSSTVSQLYNPGDVTTFASYITPILLHERIDDYDNPDSVKFVATEQYQTGDTVKVYSQQSSYIFNYILQHPMNIDDSIKVQDIVSSKFYLGANGKVLMTRQSHKFSGTPVWFEIATINGTVQSMAISKDGNNLFVGTQNGNLYRISNLNHANDSLTANAASSECVLETKKLTLSINNRAVNKIAVDPKNPSRILVALGNYGNSIYVYYCANALDDEPTFTQKQGTGTNALPKMPVYSAIFDITNTNKVILGTELGIFITDNIGTANPVWSSNNDGGIPIVPVYDLKQQVYMFPGVTNYGVIYAATHGRGIFETKTLVPVAEYNGIGSSKSLLVYPNPARDNIMLDYPYADETVNVSIYSITGTLIKSVTINTQKLSKIDVSELQNGLYLIEAKGKEKSISGKFLITR